MCRKTTSKMLVLVLLISSLSVERPSTAKPVAAAVQSPCVCVKAEDCRCDGDKQKENARDIATGGSLFTTSWLIVPVIGEFVAAGGGAFQGGFLITMGIIDALDSAPNNPDSNHGTLASVTPVRFTPVSGGTGTTIGTVGTQLVTDVNASLVSLGQSLDNLRLLRISLRRYYGALNAGNATNADFQSAAVCHFLISSEASLAAYRTSLRRISSDIQGTPAASLSFTVSQVLALRNQILNSGFPPEEAALFPQMNATNEEISLALQEVALVTGATLSNSDLTGAVIFDRAADAIKQINLGAFLPQGFPPSCGLGPSAKSDTICFHSSQYFDLNLQSMTRGTVRIGGVNFNSPISIRDNKPLISLFITGDCIPPFPPRPRPPFPIPNPFPFPFPDPIPPPFPFPDPGVPIACSAPSPPLKQLNRQYISAQLSLELAGGTGSPHVINALWTPLISYGINFVPTRLSNGFLFTPETMLKELFQQTEFAIREDRTADMLVLANLFRVLNGPYNSTGRCGLTQ